jgi:hypothetical protein
MRGWLYNWARDRSATTLGLSETHAINGHCTCTVLYTLYYIQGVRHSNFIFKMKDFFLLCAPFFALIHFFNFFPFVYYEFSFIIFFPFLLISFPFFISFIFLVFFLLILPTARPKAPIQLMLAPSVLNFSRRQGPRPNTVDSISAIGFEFCARQTQVFKLSWLAYKFRFQEKT